MEWSEDVIVQLRALWEEGHSTAEIGRRMGVSKNAIVGKAHRLSLPARPSPIRRNEGGEAARAPRRVCGPTLPPLPGAALAAASAAGVAGPVRLAVARSQAANPTPANPAAAPELRAAERRVAEPRPAEPPRPASRPVAVARSAGARTVSCCWPIGEPGTKSFRFCDAEALVNKPYCEEHAQLAYVRVRDRREDAA
jgi:GcrA cell cycle regulator